MNVDDADAVGAFVLDKQSKGVVQPQQQLKVAQAQLNIVKLNEQFHQVVVVKNTQLPHQTHILHLAALHTEYLPLSYVFTFKDVLIRTVYYLTIREGVVCQRVVL